jgi:phosphate transport system permease protein
MKKKLLNLRYLEETVFKMLMILSLTIVILSMGFILFTIIIKGFPYLNVTMLTQTSKGGYYLGKEGGILNAILGSVYLALGGTLLSILLGIPLAISINTFSDKSQWSKLARMSINILWGIPSIVYGAFGFSLMVVLGMRASLLAGIITLALLEFPIVTRSVDEFIRMVPLELEQASLGLGATQFETKIFVIVRQIFPGIITAIQLALGRGIGDAASVMFTAGYTDRIPTSLFHPAASLPLAVFFQLNSPYPEVQGRAYASALVLMIIVILISLGSRFLSSYLHRYIIS